MGQVGEDRDVVGDLPHPLQGQAVRRRLDDGRRVARRHHRPEGTLQLGRLGRRDVGRRGGPQRADLLLGRADEPGPDAGRLEGRDGHGRRRRLPVRARDADHAEPAPRVLVPPGGHHRERVLAVVDDELGRRSRGLDGLLDHHGGRAARHGLADERVPVRVGPGDRHEEPRPMSPAGSRRRSPGRECRQGIPGRHGGARSPRAARRGNPAGEARPARQLRASRRGRRRRAPSRAAPGAGTGKQRARRPRHRGRGSGDRVADRAEHQLVGAAQLEPFAPERLLEPEQPIRRLAGERLAARPADVDAAEVQLRAPFAARPAAALATGSGPSCPDGLPGGGRRPRSGCR